MSNVIAFAIEASIMTRRGDCIASEDLKKKMKELLRSLGSLIKLLVGSGCESGSPASQIWNKEGDYLIPLAS